MVHSPDRIAITSDQRRAAVIDIIAAAQSRLLLSLFRCDDSGVLDALVDAVSRGVRVEVLMTHRAKGGRKRRDLLATVLADAGATLHRYADPVAKYHAKYITADERLALVGSANWTRKCLNETCDFVLTTADAGVARALGRLFAADCSGAALERNATHERLLIGPEYARARLATLLSTARSSIDIVDPKLTDPEMRRLLDERRDAGVRITCHGERKVGGLAAHGKLLLIDRQVAVIGSLSLSALHLGFRRELALTTTDGAAVKSAHRFFTGLRSAVLPVRQRRREASVRSPQL